MCLLSVSHAPMVDVAEVCSNVVLDYLQGTPPLIQAQGQEYAFGCINRIIAISITENGVLALRSFAAVIPEIRRLWQQKCHQALKDEMLITLILGEPLLGRLSEQTGWEETEAELQKLAEALQIEYAVRNEKEMLQLDDLELVGKTSHVQNYMLTYPSFRLSFGPQRSEQAWSLLRIVAVLFAFLQSRRNRHGIALSSDDDDGGGLQRKRRRLDRPVVAVFHAIANSEGFEKVARLQSLGFIAGEVPFEADAMQGLFDCTIPLISSENGHYSGWAMLTLSS